ncbi:hypothetical protein CS542_10310 [Pedobacter sp. IW39]|nr:hypothetical protein CS542_10310 [Pedobacter sp. IW39]
MDGGIVRLYLATGWWLRCLNADIIKTQQLQAGNWNKLLLETKHIGKIQNTADEQLWVRNAFLSLLILL